MHHDSGTEYVSVWQPASSLSDLGLDSLDLVQLRNAFQKGFKCSMPLAVFTNARSPTGFLSLLSHEVPIVSLDIVYHHCKVFG